MPYINLCCTMILKRIWLAGGVCLRHTCMPCTYIIYYDLSLGVAKCIFWALV